MTNIQTPDQIAAHRGPGAHRHVQRRLSDRAADRLAPEQTRHEVGGALGQEVAVGVRRGAVRVRCRLADPGALDEHDHRHRERTGYQVERHQPEIRQVRQRDTARDRAGVGDPGDLVETGDHHDDRGHDQCHHGADGRKAGACQHYQEDDRRQPDEQSRRLHCGRIEEHGECLGQRERAGRGGAGEVGDLPGHDVDRDAGQEAEHHRVRHEPGVPTEPGEPGAEGHQPGERCQQKQRLGPVLRRDVGDHRTGRQRGGAGGADDHQPRAGAEATDHRPQSTRVQAVHRVHPGQHGRGHPVRHTAHRTR
jgi:hypothetical protein